jgi:large subunit ribosomal protein L25
MKQMTLEANIRTGVGKGYCHRLRAKGLIPGILYGGGKENIPIELKPSDLIHILHEAGENVLINLVLPNSTQEVVILKERQIHPYKDFLLHADFCRISLDKKLTVTVPIELVGTAKGVKEGGILEQIMWQIEVSALPTQIPASIKVDVTNLEINSTIHIKDLVVEEGVELKAEPDSVVLNILPPKEEVEEEEEKAEAPPEEEAEPEVIKEKKKEEKEEK